MLTVGSPGSEFPGAGGTAPETQSTRAAAAAAPIPPASQRVREQRPHALLFDKRVVDRALEQARGWRGRAGPS
jgi:hypothetical protein